MRRIFLCFQVFVTFLTGTSIAETVTDAQLGYSVYLPDFWVKTAVTATQHRFEDTSGACRSMIVINRYDFSSETVFPTSEDWTRANFIAYIFSIDADPFSIVTYYDSVNARQNGTLWAAEVFSQFFSIDTVLGDGAEFIRFTASGTYGYEIYAIGPEEDMVANIGVYIAVIEGITLPETPVSVIGKEGFVQAAGPAGYSVNGPVNFDLLGRIASRDQAHQVRLLKTGGSAGIVSVRSMLSLGSR